MHEVLLERGVERDLRRLPAAEFVRIVRAIKALAANPRPPGCRKISGSKRDWRIRVGNYRVIYEIDDPHRQIKVMRVRIRPEAYR